MRRVVARSLVAASPGEDRTALLELLRARIPTTSTPFAAWRAGRRARTRRACVVSLLLNENHKRFDDLYASSPRGSRAICDPLPARVPASVRAPWRESRRPSDPYFPLPEAEAVVQLVPEGRLTVTRVLDHTRPSLSLSQLGDFARFLRWVRRCLRGRLGVTPRPTKVALVAVLATTACALRGRRAAPTRRTLEPGELATDPLAPHRALRRTGGRAGPRRLRAPAVAAADGRLEPRAVPRLSYRFSSPSSA